MNTKLTISILLVTGSVLHLSTVVSGTAIKELSEKKYEERCKFPGKELLRSSGYENLFTTKDGLLVPAVSAASLMKWKECAGGQVEKAWVEKTLRRLKRSFVKMEGGVEAIKMSRCPRDEVLELFDPAATSEQAEKAGSCLIHVFENQDGTLEDKIDGVVRIDEDCEREKRNKIRDAQAKVTARLIATAAAGVCCAAAPVTGGFAVAWCSVFAALAAETLAAEAELYAAQNIECPTCEPEP